MNRKNLYISLLLIILGIILHFLFRDSNKFIGITSLIVGISYLISTILTKNNK
ncbi:hypothetical protein [uncultured Anaerococcus sp.]|uniref:hypothetical protein n=1 Tax=uncultured Anaerococcus sp. TaxID=293428 RepID=UPI0025F5CC8D|nr:hypothetical protein [uncultured Anaerococcus sp.]